MFMELFSETLFEIFSIRFLTDPPKKSVYNWCSHWEVLLDLGVCILKFIIGGFSFVLVSALLS